MGNRNSCCAASSPPPVRKNSQSPLSVPNSTEWKNVNSSGSHGNLPHISDREPDYMDETNPSTHGTAGTLFMERSKVSESKYLLIAGIVPY